MSRKDDLEQLIRASYNIILEYQKTIQASDDAKEKLRMSRDIDEQWNLIAGYWAEYERLPKDKIPADITEIVAELLPRPPLAHPPLQRPPRVEHFVGRQDELERLLADLQPGMVVTLCGPGGIGKSALAAEAIWTLCPGDDPPERFPDGIITYDFYNQPQATLALEAISRACGQEPRPTPQDAARRALAGRKVLLFLDGAEDADDLQAVLRVCGSCGVLITSRSRHDAQDVRQDLQPLELDEAVALLRAWGKGQAANEAACRAICKLLGGLPLAVRLVGRYLEQTGESAAEHLAWLRDTPIQALSHGEHREDSVRLLLAHSLDQAGGGARQVLTVVGLLALDSFSVEPVACALKLEATVAKRLLGSLVNYSLLEPLNARYKVSHALVHTFARKCCQPSAEAVAGLADHYVNLPEALSQDGMGYGRLHTERPHFISVSRFLCHSGSYENLKLLHKLHLAWNEYYDQCGLWGERRVMLEEAVGVISRSTIPMSLELGELEIQLADVHRRQLDDLEKPLELYQRGMDLIQSSHQEPNLLPARLHRQFGDLYRARGEFHKALEQYTEAERQLPQRDPASEEGKLRSSMADAYARSGISLEKAVQEAEESLRLERDVVKVDLYETAQSHRLLADVCLACGRNKEAAQHIAQARQIFEQEGYHDNPVMVWVLRTQGDAYLSQEKPQEAIGCYREAAKILRNKGMDMGEAVLSKKLGLWELRHGDMLAALGKLQEAACMAKAIRGTKYTYPEMLLSRVEGSFAAQSALEGCSSDYVKENLAELEGYANETKGLHKELTDLVRDDEDLEVIWAHLNLVCKRSEIAIGVADSVSARKRAKKTAGAVDSTTYDPLDALEHANEHRFRLLQVYLADRIRGPNECVRDKLVKKAQQDGIRLMCHAPGLLNQASFNAPDVTQDAQAVLLNTQKKWVVHHFDEKEPLDRAVDLVERINQSGLIPCIENYHRLGGPEQARENYRLYKKLFDMIRERDLCAHAVLDIPRLFKAELGLNTQEATQLTFEVFEHLVALEVPILLHLIDSTTAEQADQDWCPLGAEKSVIPFADILKRLFAAQAQIEAVVFEFKDKKSSVPSRRFLEECIREGMQVHYPKLEVRWIG